jgi:hypothetical protein
MKVTYSTAKWTWYYACDHGKCEHTKTGATITYDGDNGSSACRWPGWCASGTFLNTSFATGRDRPRLIKCDRFRRPNIQVVGSMSDILHLLGRVSGCSIEQTAVADLPPITKPRVHAQPANHCHNSCNLHAKRAGRHGGQTCLRRGHTCALYDGLSSDTHWWKVWKSSAPAATRACVAYSRFANLPEIRCTATSCLMPFSWSCTHSYGAPAACLWLTCSRLRTRVAKGRTWETWGRTPRG